MGEEKGGGGVLIMTHFTIFDSIKKNITNEREKINILFLFTG